jgi:hypothetical protein
MSPNTVILGVMHNRLSPLNSAPESYSGVNGLESSLKVFFYWVPHIVSS